MRRTLRVTFDADEIVPGLYQGSSPPRTTISYPAGGTILRDSGFDTVVLCANSIQPPSHVFVDVEVLRAPNEDDSSIVPSRAPLLIAIEAARQVAARVKDDKNVLVTCQAGLNRSGLVSAIALHFIYGWDGERCIDQVQSCRRGALFNEQFVRVLKRLPLKD